MAFDPKEPRDTAGRWTKIGQSIAKGYRAATSERFTGFAPEGSTADKVVRAGAWGVAAPLIGAAFLGPAGAVAAGLVSITYGMVRVKRSLDSYNKRKLSDNEVNDVVKKARIARWIR